MNVVFIFVTFLLVVAAGALLGVAAAAGTPKKCSSVEDVLAAAGASRAPSRFTARGAGGVVTMGPVWLGAGVLAQLYSGAVWGAGKRRARFLGGYDTSGLIKAMLIQQGIEPHPGDGQLQRRHLLATPNASPSASSLWESRLRSLLDHIGQGEGWVTKG